MEQNKKRYYISVYSPYTGDALVDEVNSGETEEYLTQSEYDVVKRIFNNVTNNTVQCSIYEIPTDAELYQKLELETNVFTYTDIKKQIVRLLITDYHYGSLSICNTIATYLTATLYKFYQSKNG